MKQETRLTARTRDGQEVRFNYEDVIIERPDLKYKTLYAKANSKFWADLGLNVPQKLHGQDLLIEIAEQDEVRKLEREKFEREVEELKARKAKALEAPIIGLTYKIGCDCADTLYFHYDDKERLEWDISSHRRDEHARLLEKVRKIIHSENGKFKQNIDSDLGCYGGYEIGEEIIPVIEQAKAEMKKEDEAAKIKKQEKQAEYDIQKSEAIQEAKETGRNVYIKIVGGYDGDERYPGKELGWVNIVEMATPDGKIITSDSPSY